MMGLNIGSKNGKKIAGIPFAAHQTDTMSHVFNSFWSWRIKNSNFTNLFACLNPAMVCKLKTPVSVLLPLDL